MKTISDQTLKDHGFTKVNEYDNAEWWQKGNLILTFCGSDVFFYHSDSTDMNYFEQLLIREMIDDMKRAEKEAR